MSTNKYIDSEVLQEIGYPQQRLTWAKKKAKGFQWAERCADFYDHYYGYYYDSERMKRLRLNYNLYNGRGEEAMRAYVPTMGAELEEEGLSAGYDEIQHLPLIDQIAKAMVGEQQRRPLKPLAIDASGYSMNMRKMHRNKLFQQYLSQKYLEPIRQQAMMDVMYRLKITDPYSLSPEEQDQFMSQVDQESKLMTPDEIDNYMRKDYKSPSEMQGQKLVDWAMSHYDIKYLTDQGFKHGIISGEEIYYVTVRHNMPHIELVNPVGFMSSSSRNTHFIEDGEWAKYEQRINLSDLHNKFGDIMESADLAKLDGVFNSFADSNIAYDSMQSRLVAEVSAADAHSGGKIFENSPDIRTKAGQEYVKAIYQRFGSDDDGYSSIRHVHIVWKSLRKLIYLTRVTQEGIKHYWLDESYKYNQSKGDISQKVIWVPEVWEVDKIGTTDAIYLNKRPIPYQYASVDNPWNTKLPYIGVEYGRLFGNAKNVAPLDLGKPWQYKYNVQMAKIHEMEATDVGKVLLTTMNAKPKEWSWGKWIMMMKYGKIAPIDTTNEDWNPGIDSQIFKDMDLSTMSDVAGRLQYLEFIRQQAALSMSYNPSRLGQVAPYVAVSNNQQSIVQSSYQTEDIYSTHNKVVENLLNYMLKITRVAFKDNEFARTYILDDMSVAELEIDWQLMSPAELAVKVRNSTDDYNNIMNVKSVAQAMVQNGLITMPELIRLMWANNGAEILNIAERAEKGAADRRQEEVQNQQMLMQQQAQIQKQMQEMMQQFEMQKMNHKAQVDMILAEINSTRYAQQHDINLNQINDAQERDRIKIQHEAIQNEKDRALDLKKHEDEMRLKAKEIRLKGMKTT